MKKLLILSAMAASLAACTSRNVLTAKFNGFDNDTVIVKYYDYSEYISPTDDGVSTTDTLVMKNGVIKIAPDLERPKLIIMTPATYLIPEGDHRITDGSGVVYALMRKGERIKMSIDQHDGYVTHSAEGSKLNSDIAEVDNLYREIFKEYFEAVRIVEFNDTVRKRISDARGKMTAMRTNYIDTHLDCEIAAYLLPQIDADTAVKYYETMDKSLFADLFKPVEDKLLRYKEVRDIKNKAAEIIVEGAEAPDFTLKNLDGNDLSLSSLRGKWTVIDFWGSWCGFCIKGIPEMKQYYAKYSKKLEILSVACNDKDKAWQEAVAKYELPWLNVINPRNCAPADDISIRYGVKGYPTKIILTPEGRIHKVFLGEVPDFYKELDKVLK